MQLDHVGTLYVRLSIRLGGRMKLRELVEKTGVSTETIQFYLREGILPKPRKRGRAQADYGDHYVELVSLIKNLQKKHFLPFPL